ncbi:hypothetical protein Ade02nite_20800 [Paractinoplanes deccanensis]|uniref:Uncharacterized protein n=1 Tax=Paractinoplanes deccanensis TaxID=113561 RepID=A0ABQ3Y0C5_9ACTN|nr:hypothetical protein [Actinoplanes deccanensis]GID73439.1 hypothetical protein Ade02nite_20800 [Actinoplanes deccanensis]
MIPGILKHERIMWEGVDSSTPDGCTMVTAHVLGVVATYVLRDGQVLGRIENIEGRNSGYAGSTLKGGYFLGQADDATLARRIADYADAKESA